MASLNPAFSPDHISREEEGLAGALHSADAAFEFALRTYGVPRLLKLDHLKGIDEMSVFTYLSLLKSMSSLPMEAQATISHSVFLLGEGAEMHATLVGRKVFHNIREESVWKRDKFL
jgi:hypothetical protein